MTHVCFQSVWLPKEQKTRRRKSICLWQSERAGMLLADSSYRGLAVGSTLSWDPLRNCLHCRGIWGSWRRKQDRTEQNREGQDRTEGIRTEQKRVGQSGTGQNRRSLVRHKSSEWSNRSREWKIKKFSSWCVNRQVSLSLKCSHILTPVQVKTKQFPKIWPIFVPLEPVQLQLEH